MVLRVQHVEGEFRVILPAEALEALHLTEGSKVELLPVEPGQPVIRYISVDETLSAYRDTLPQHREAYLELAK
jgi:antitoxin component of MazEF toxin-antitoxin module